MLADTFNREIYYPKEQVINSTFQIKNRGQLQVGLLYRFFSFSLMNSTLIVGPRFKLIDLGIETAGIIIEDPHRKREELELNLSQLGIIPYPDGTWNPTNYLIPAG